MMAAPVKISMFMGGDRDYPENVEEYLEDVEAAALSWDSYCSPHMVINAEATDKSKIRFFRQNLGRQGDAWHWWYYILEDTKKSDWAKIRAEFTARYGSKVTQAASLFEVQNEIISLRQEEQQHITDYVREVEKLSRRVPKEMDSLLGISFIKGMRDEGGRERVSFDLKDSANFTFTRALTVVKAASQIIGEADPFNPKNSSLNGNGARYGNGNGNGDLKGEDEFNSPLYVSTEIQLIPRRTSNVNTTQTHSVLPKPPSRPANIPIRAEPKSSISQEEFHTLMSNFMSSMGFSRSESPVGSGLPPSRLHQPGSYRGGYRDSIVCYNCGMRGHYSDGCTSAPLSVLERQQIRDNDRREKYIREGYFEQPPPATGSNLVEILPQLRPSTLLPNRGGFSPADGSQEHTSAEREPCLPAEPILATPPRIQAPQPAAAACVKIDSTERGGLGEACAILARIPAVATIFEKALVVKRARLDDVSEDEEDEDAHRPTRQRLSGVQEQPVPLSPRRIAREALQQMDTDTVEYFGSGTQTVKVPRKSQAEKLPAPLMN